MGWQDGKATADQHQRLPLNWRPGGAQSVLGHAMRMEASWVEQADRIARAGTPPTRAGASRVLLSELNKGYRCEVHKANVAADCPQSCAIRKTFEEASPVGLLGPLGGVSSSGDSYTPGLGKARPAERETTPGQLVAQTQRGQQAAEGFDSAVMGRPGESMMTRNEIKKNGDDKDDEKEEKCSKALESLLKVLPKKREGETEFQRHIRHHMHHRERHPGGQKQAVAIAASETGQSKALDALVDVLKGEGRLYDDFHHAVKEHGRIVAEGHKHTKVDHPTYSGRTQRMYAHADGTVTHGHTYHKNPGATGFVAMRGKENLDAGHTRIGKFATHDAAVAKMKTAGFKVHDHRDSLSDDTKHRSNIASHQEVERHGMSVGGGGGEGSRGGVVTGHTPSGEPIYGTKKSLGDHLSDVLKAGKTGAGSRGGKIAYYTKTGNPVYESTVKRLAPQMDRMMRNWHQNATNSRDPEDHATAAKQALVAAFHHHHSGNSIDSLDALEHADHHRRQYEAHGHSSRTTKWVDKHHGATNNMIRHPKKEKSFGDTFGALLKGDEAADVKLAHEIEELVSDHLEDYAADEAKEGHIGKALAELIKAEGDRGGHVIGHTRSGKPIYADNEASAINPSPDDRSVHGGHGGKWNPVGHSARGGDRSKRAIFNHFERHYGHFSPEDHHRAMAAHEEAYQDGGDVRHRKMATLHREHAIWKRDAKKSLGDALAAAICG